MTSYKPVYADVTEGQPKSRVSLDLTKEETATEPSATQELYMFVGWVLPDVDSKSIAKQAKIQGQNRKHPLGTVRPKDEDLFTPGDELPLMAVVRTATGEFDPATRQSLPSFVLLKQRNGLCTPYMVPQNNIFYLANFRDNTNDRKSRGKNWNDLVARASVTASSTTPSTKRARISKARDYTKLQLGPTASLRNEIATLISCYEVSDRIEFIHELKSVLIHIDDDLKYMPIDNRYMHRFVDAADESSEQEELFTFDDATKMIEEMKKSWPDVHATAEEIHLIQRGMTVGRVVIEYRTMREFILECLHHLRKQEIEEDDVRSAAVIAEEAIATIRRLQACVIPPLVVSDNKYQRLLRALRNKLAEMVNTNEEFVNMLKDAAGDAALGVNYQDIWGTYADSLDTDTARKAFDEIVRLLVVAFRQAEYTMAKKVQEIVKHLDDANIC